MNESVFRQLLGELMVSEFAEYDNPPKWKFSLKHRIAMRRIFARYERNVQKLKQKPIVQTIPIEQHHTYRNIKQRLIIVLCIVLLLALLMGCVIVYVSKDFRGTVYEDNTHLFPVNLENSLQTIEYEYVLSCVPEGFELIETISSRTNVYTEYKNELTNQTITFCQWVKSHYTPHLNTEYHPIEEVEIDGKTGVCIDFSYDYNQSLIVWDNGDYVIEIMADFDKTSVINLCKINRL